MRIDESLYDQLQIVAAQRGLPYQRLIQEFLRQALGTMAPKEGRKAKG